MAHAAAREVSFFTAVAVLEDEGVVENEVKIMEEVNDGWGCGHTQEPGRLVPLPVEMLPPRIQRRGEKRARLPLEGLFAPSLVPDGSSTPPREHVDQLLVEGLLRLKTAARPYLYHVGVVGTAGPFQVDVGAQSPLPLPGGQLHALQIVDVKTPYDGYPLLLQPLLIRGQLAKAFLAGYGCGQVAPPGRFCGPKYSRIGLPGKPSSHVTTK